MLFKKQYFNFSCFVYLEGSSSRATRKFECTLKQSSVPLIPACCGANDLDMFVACHDLI